MKVVEQSSVRDSKRLQFALRVATGSNCRQRHGAVVVKGGRVLASATNIDKNHPNIIEPEKVRMAAAICAERRALARVKDPRGATIFVARLMKCGAAGNSKPCERCYAACKAAGIVKVVYT